jgi:hypothetical protein
VNKAYNRNVLVLDGQWCGRPDIIELDEAMMRIDDHANGTLMLLNPGKLGVYRGELMEETIWLY